MEFTYTHVWVISIGLTATFYAFKGFSVFTVFFAHILGVPYQHFAIVMGMTNLGGVVTFFLGPIVANLPANVLLGFSQLAVSFCVFMLMVPVAAPLPWWMFWMFGAGIAVCLLYIFGQTAIGVFFESEEDQLRGSAIIETSWAVGGTGFLVIGVLLAHMSYQYVLLIIGAICLPFSLVFFVMIPRGSLSEDEDVEEDAGAFDTQASVLNGDEEKPLIGQESSSFMTDFAEASKSRIEMGVNDTHRVWTDPSCLILFVGTFFFGFAINLMYTTMGALYRNYFGFTVAQVGYMSIVLVAGEILACVVVILGNQSFPPVATCVGGGLMIFLSMTSMAMLVLAKALPLVVSAILVAIFAIGGELLQLRVFYLPIEVAPAEKLIATAESGTVLMYTGGQAVGGFVAGYCYVAGGYTLVGFLIGAAGLLTAGLFARLWSSRPAPGKVVVAE